MIDDKDDWVLLARVVRPQGRHGEVLAEIFTDFPQAFSTRKRVFLRSPGSAPSQQLQETRVESQWLHKDRVVLKFVRVESITDAEQLRGCEVVVPREERMPLEEGAVYVSDLIGASVIDVSPNGIGLAGQIIDVEPEATGPAMLVLRSASGEEQLIPFVRAFLRNVDLEAGRVEMELPAGLLTMQTPAAAPGSENTDDREDAG